MSGSEPEPEWKPKLSIREVDAILTGPGMLLETERAIIDGRVLRVYKNQPPNVRKFWLGSVMQFKDKDYVVFESERYTYQQIHERASRFASLLYTDYGVRKGDRVAIAMRNYPEFITTFWGIHLIGAIPTFINAWAPTEPLLYCLQLTDPKVLIVDAERAARVSRSGGILDKIKDNAKSSLRKVLVVRPHEGASAKYRGIHDFESTLASYSGPENAWSTAPEALPDEGGSIFFTSGTTGRPKGVLSSQRAFIQNTFNGIASRLRVYLRNGEELPVLGAPQAEGELQKAGLLSVPLFHVTGCTSTLMPNTALGSKIVLMRRWDANEAARLITSEKITTCGGVPSMAADLLDTDLQSDILEGVSFGGAPASSSTAPELAKRFKNAVPGQGYGLTETNALAACHADFVAKPSSTGWACPVVDIIVVDIKGEKIMPPHQIGEVWIKGPNVMTCYWNDPAATAKAITKDGWFKSGDLGYLDEEGFLFIKDRVKDIMIRGGENIHSIEVEDALYKDERILEAAAVSVPDKRLGELVAARVTTRPGFHGQVKEEEVLEVASKFLPAHAVPVMVLVSDKPVERNAPGKIMKDVVRKEVRAEWAKRLKAQTRGKGKKTKAKL
ncbi:long-chain-fatty-acid-CoA ligase [Rickenella mellea]|uniref:Long-chain-fatty-acid-CoA ligase n=1 Tax=Rickenella mellea TaxID=50990 RepID=A0A4Y7Q234_9AGAM|nr:long-chain-fatty-acid-CoA ligase [Rickenella mellea]